MSDPTDPSAGDEPAVSSEPTVPSGDEPLAADEGTAPGPDEVDDVPTVSCARCGQEWDLAHELDDLQVGNRALEQFALDHERHTGHFPDGVATWRAECRRCPGGAERLTEGSARRWAETHARHTHHSVDLRPATGDGTERIDPE